MEDLRRRRKFTQASLFIMPMYVFLICLLFRILLRQGDKLVHISQIKLKLVSPEIYALKSTYGNILVDSSRSENSYYFFACCIACSQNSLTSRRAASPNRLNSFSNLSTQQ